jgi:glycosyltransferase involved in cell wall biosynthesis
VSNIICTVTNDLVYDQRMMRICGSLQQNGYNVTLVGRVMPDSADLTKQPFEQHRIPCWFNRGPAFYLEYNIRLLFYFLKNKPNIINSADVDTVMGAKWFKYFASFTWVFDAHEHFTEVPEVTNRRFVKSIWSLVERKVFRKADKFYTVSASLAKIFQKKYNKNVEVIRNVPLLRYKIVVEPKSDFSETGFLIYQGALNKGRCIELYIKAMHQIDAQLYLVGEGDLSDALRLLVKTEQLENKVTFTGKIHPKDLRHLTKNALMGLNVLENIGLSYYYSLSNKCFDYVQAQIPSISSNFPEYATLNAAHEVMRLTEPTLEGIVQSIKELQSNQELYLRLRKNCKIAATDWNWEKEEIKLLAQYE